MKIFTPHMWSVLIQSMGLLDLCGLNFHPPKSNKYSQKLDSSQSLAEELVEFSICIITVGRWTVKSSV